MMDDNIFILRLKRQCNTYPFCDAEVGKFYCVKIYRGLSPRGVDCCVVKWIGKDSLPAFVNSMDWVRYYFDFK